MILIVSFLPAWALGQGTKVRGSVFESVTQGSAKTLEPLYGANVFWLGTTIGMATGHDGRFEVEKPKTFPAQLVVSYVGYQSDTIQVVGVSQELKIVLSAASQLDEVVVTARELGTHFSSMEPILTQVLTEAEFKRAACCNLSEAFETNASVDVTFSDAVTGAKQIQLLGLAGVYGQILTENMPIMRGLAQPFGLTYTPGPWLESIQVSKGSASVVNGYESITGQINVELHKPEKTDRFFLNLFANDNARLEGTMRFAGSLGKRWDGLLMVHGEMLDKKVDHNGNGFLDDPLVRKVNALNRYRFFVPGVVESQFGFRILSEKREGGQMRFFETDQPAGSSQYYGIGVNTNRYEAFARTGFFFRNMPNASLGTQLQFSYHDHDSHYGNTNYGGSQKIFYGNVLFENTLSQNSSHSYTVGASLMYDDLNETLGASQFDRREVVPGVFAQLTLNALQNDLSVILGGRVDFHNLFGTFVTPRLHARYSLGNNTTIRTSLGKGLRNPSPIAENAGLLASSRAIRLGNDIEPEKAWNFGGSFSQKFRALGRDASFTADFYRTEFQNKLVVDAETNPAEVRFTNLEGKAFANNYQVELTLEPLKRFELLAAFRYTESRVTINNQLVEQPLVPRYKGLLSGSLSTSNNKWQFDLTAQLNGPIRVLAFPDNKFDPMLGSGGLSPVYVYLLGQVTYRSGLFDIYLGSENITNYKQHHPIHGASDPFGPSFDASMVWGPVMGRKIYAGMRMAIGR